MKLWPFGSKALPPMERKTAVIPVPQGSVLELALSGGSVSPSEAFRFYRGNAAAGTAIDMIGDSFKQIAPVLQVSDGEYITDHPVIQLLRNPNDFHTWEMLAERISKNFLITGNSHLTGVGNVRRPPIEIYPVKAGDVSTMQGVDNYPQTYMVTVGKGVGTYSRTAEPKQNRVRFLAGTLQELYHIMGYSSTSTEIAGDSPLQAIALEVKQQIQGKFHNLQVLNNGGRLSMLVTFKDSMDNEQHLERRELIQEQFGGAGNSGKIGVVSSADMDIKEFGITNKDMDYKELDEAAAKCIYSRYKIPLPLVSNDASTFNNMASAVTHLYDFAVLPHADFLLAGLSMFLLPRFGIDPTEARITYNPDSITALMDRRLDQLKKRKDIGVETIDEYRSLLPNRADTEGGSNLLVPFNSMPLKDVEKASERRINPPAAPVSVKKKIHEGIALKSMEQKRSQEAESAARELEAKRQAKPYEVVLKAQGEATLEALAKVDDLDAITASQAVLRVIEDFRPEWSEAIKDNYLETGGRWSSEVVFSSKAFEDDVISAIDETLEREQIILTEISLIEQGTAEIIAGSVATGLEQGSSIAVIQQGILDAGAFSATRALRIARTITGSAASLGQLMAGEMSGATKKVWLDSGNNVRDGHKARNGETVKIGGRFSVQYGSSVGARWPSDPQISAADRINCRCSLTFER